ncbi:protein containing DUF927 [gut metagenome]|uniref:Protein containing DUF927 n=1 Tax=gut metagenome TaxID=749906 RepID=J9CXI8_9ZZZZ
MKFVPYNSELTLDVDDNDTLIQSIKSSEGTLQEWSEYITPLVENNLYFRLVMAASFASVLIEKVNALPFILHLWGGTGTGKTVALMCASSVWGNPRVGCYTLSLNMTQNALLQTAATLYNLPLIGDELQTIKNQQDGYDKLIMCLTEGVDKGRLNTNSERKQMKKWKNAFLTSGEEPITQVNSGGGVKNRVIELENHEQLIPNGNETVNFITNHYGVAGKPFIEYLQSKPVEQIRKDVNDIQEILLQLADTSGKQAIAMALLAIADTYASECVYHCPILELQTLATMLKTKAEIAEPQRAFASIVDVIAENSDKFDREHDNGDHFSAYWGRLFSNGTVKINKTVLDNELQKLGTSFNAVKKAWLDSGYLEFDDKQQRYYKADA